MYANDLDMFTLVQLLEDPLGLLSLVEFCEENGFNCRAKEGEPPCLIEKCKGLNAFPKSCTINRSNWCVAH